jgi:glucose-6-phosphate 1-epimerase
MALSHGVKFSRTPLGLDAVELSVGTASVALFLFGGHVTSWREGADEFLFVSKTAVLDGTKPIRGGIPICWPQFGAMGPLGQHGFARNAVVRCVFGLPIPGVLVFRLPVSELTG